METQKCWYRLRTALLRDFRPGAPGPSAPPAQAPIPAPPATARTHERQPSTSPTLLRRQLNDSAASQEPLSGSPIQQLSPPVTSPPIVGSPSSAASFTASSSSSSSSQLSAEAIGPPRLGRIEVYDLKRAQFLGWVSRSPRSALSRHDAEAAIIELPWGSNSREPRQLRMTVSKYPTILSNYRDNTPPGRIAPSVKLTIITLVCIAKVKIRLKAPRMIIGCCDPARRVSTMPLSHRYRS